MVIKNKRNLTIHENYQKAVDYLNTYASQYTLQEGEVLYTRYKTGGGVVVPLSGIYLNNNVVCDAEYVKPKEVVTLNCTVNFEKATDYELSQLTSLTTNQTIYSLCALEYFQTKVGQPMVPIANIFKTTDKPDVWHNLSDNTQTRFNNAKNKYSDVLLAKSLTFDGEVKCENFSLPITKIYFQNGEKRISIDDVTIPRVKFLRSGRSYILEAKSILRSSPLAFFDPLYLLNQNLTGRNFTIYDNDIITIINTKSTIK